MFRPVEKRNGDEVNVLLYLAPLAIFIALLGVYGVFWSIKNKQYEDLKRYKSFILHDDDL